MVARPDMRIPVVLVRNEGCVVIHPKFSCFLPVSPFADLSHCVANLDVSPSIRVNELHEPGKMSV